MRRATLRVAALALVLVAASSVAVACNGDDDDTTVGATPTATAQPAAARTALEELRVELEQAGAPAQKTELVLRCNNAVELLQGAPEPQYTELKQFCTSLAATDPNTPAAWDLLRRRLNELIGNCCTVPTR